MNERHPRAVVLLSGGLDSTTTLAIAQAQGFCCFALSFDYGQRHASELSAGTAIAKAMSVAEHRVLRIGLDDLGGSALTDVASPLPKPPSKGIPATYVPARNTIFLAYALAYAEVLQAHDIFIGVNAIDYSGYPDCRPEFITAFEHMANLATKSSAEDRSCYHISTPLIQLTKAEIIQCGARLGVDYSITVSCYNADQIGRACGRCDACYYRAKGFRQAGMPDPTRYQPGVSVSDTSPSPEEKS
ncbi:7-cyano-7-deazaguanine synthase QueC [Nitrococcus mobilis]|uniref:7-cyano-7-deazaguanine synthase n=1 Tax=Nitrococcus mobilis Nb-231 TaxID=314278 RepID=A4BLV0_9GAMM|nr:7-cyano-7-deazaguanine synthase QueC [Nitrococcus mobilis]EAR23288.1 exsB protein [Nitrococcus mobilis Nb-231]